MSNNKDLDILLHFMTVKSEKATAIPKKQQYPVNIKTIIPSLIASTISGINTKMRLETIESLLSTIVETADISGFNRAKLKYFVDKNQFFAGSYLYGIVDNQVDIESSTNGAINSAWVAIKDESIWRATVTNAHEVFEKIQILGKTRNGSTNVPKFKDVLVSRTLHLVVLVSTDPIRASKVAKKRATPQLASDSIHASAAKVAKMKESSRFKLNFTQLNLEIHSPIWKVNDSKNDIVVVKPMSSTTEISTFDFRPYIVRGSDAESQNLSDSSFPSSASMITQAQDDLIGHHFRLSHFRKEIMLLGLNSNSDFYSGKISEKSKLYINQSFTSNAWKEVRTTQQLHQIIMEESEKKKRIVKDSLKLRVSLGYIRNIRPIVDSLDSYFEEEAFVGFSQDPSLAMSPETKKNSSDRRACFNDANDQVETLLMRMYSDKESCLYHGFLLEHRMTFSRSLRRMIKGGSFCDNKSLFETLQDSKKLLNEDEVTQYLLDPYYQEGKFDLTKEQHPKKDKYPPKNRMLQCPQLFEDWEKQLRARGEKLEGHAGDDPKRQNFSSILERLVSTMESSNQSSSITTNEIEVIENVRKEKGGSNDSEKIEFITFKCKWDPAPICIMLEDNITMDSTMQDILLADVGDDPSINEEFGLDINSKTSKLFFRLEIGNNELVLRKSQFLKHTVHRIRSIKDITFPITIEIVKTFEK